MRGGPAPQSEPEVLQTNLTALQAEEVRAAAVEPPVHEPDPLQQLEQLDRLRQGGVLNETEFETAKARLLSRL